jgi:hypothetical protein
MVVMTIDPEQSPADMGWWVISEEGLKGLLQRAAQGEDVDLLYLELYANSKDDE